MMWRARLDVLGSREISKRLRARDGAVWRKCRPASDDGVKGNCSEIGEVGGRKRSWWLKASEEADGLGMAASESRSEAQFRREM